MLRWILASLIVVGLALTACSKGATSGQGSDGDGGNPLQLTAQVASYEVLSGTPNRVLVGLFTPKGIVSYGTVEMDFSFIGTKDAPEDPSRAFTTTGTFILVPEETDGAPIPTDEELAAAQEREPKITLPTEARGVYQASDVGFDTPGYWQVDVKVDLADGTAGSATAAFEVTDEPIYPAPGQRAPRAETLTIADIGKDLAAVSVDSRASNAKDIPDPDLHGVAIDDAIAAGTPVVVVVATPVYCQSRFCGPITDEVAGLQERYGDRAQFVHLEIWKDFQDKVVNKGAAAWAYRDKQLTEPWIFLVGSDGKIVDRWQNVLDPRELGAELEQLPVREP